MNLDLLDRFLLLAEEQELDIVIVINKIDKDKKENYLAAAECIGMQAMPLSAQVRKRKSALMLRYLAKINGKHGGESFVFMG